MIDDDKLSYVVTWYDDKACFDRTFTLSYWPSEKSVEMVEKKNKKLFLRKYKTTEIQESDLFLGNTVTLLGRQLKVLEYADEFTKDKEKHVQESSFGLVKPSHMSEIGQILCDIYNTSGLSISQAKIIQITGSLAEALLQQHSGEDNFQDLVKTLTQGPSLALVLVGENCVRCWKELTAAHLELGGQDGSNVESGVHCSKSIESAEREIELFFPRKSHTNPYLSGGSTAQLFNSTCCIILPHAVKQRKAGEIISSILGAGFRITALQSFHLDFAKSEEFLEIYKNVVENYGDMVKCLSSGVCLALEITLDSTEVNANHDNQESDIVQQFRDFVGPRDPEIARKLRPNSLRARFGGQGCEYAVHCTDLPEDGKLEVEYFFKILQM